MSEIGPRGLEADLVINQKCSLTFTVVHKDANGNVIDHSQSTGHVALSAGADKVFKRFDNAVTCTASNIVVSLSPEDTNIRSGAWPWDLIIDTANGDTIRLIYGTAYVIDTYAKD